MTATIRKNAWNTYRTTGYTHQVGDDPRATGGVHRHQVRLYRGTWQYRCVDSNGNFRSAGPVSPLSKEDGEAKFLMAK